MTASPAEVLHQFLDESNAFDGWDAWINNTVDGTNGRSVSIYDTAGRIQGKSHPTSETIQHAGIMVQIRATSQGEGYAKIAEIYAAMDQVRNASVTIGGTEYRLIAATPASTIQRLGKEQPEDYLWLYTSNFLVAITGAQA